MKILQGFVGLFIIVGVFAAYGSSDTFNTSETGDSATPIVRGNVAAKRQGSSENLRIFDRENATAERHEPIKNSTTPDRKNDTVEREEPRENLTLFVSNESTPIRREIIEGLFVKKVAIQNNHNYLKKIIKNFIVVHRCKGCFWRFATELLEYTFYLLGLGEKPKLNSPFQCHTESGPIADYKFQQEDNYL